MTDADARRDALRAADFSRQPFVLAWELTRACNLACVHCRAEAQLRRDPRELSTAEAKDFIDHVAGFEIPPILIMTGGDPMRRPDVIDLISHATARGVQCTITPAGTPLATGKRLAAARDAGLRRVALSIDGSTAERHDGFRRVPGSFGWTLDIARHATALGLPIQIHTTLSKRTVDDLPAVADLVDSLGAAVWAVFCLVPTGRAAFADEVDADVYERVFGWLRERSARAAWMLKLTEGYHFRRVLAQHGQGALQGLGFVASDGIGRAPRAVNAGNGFCFVSHTGDVCPSGFLPIVAGNVRERSIVELYREHPLFQELRNPSLLKGKCGHCEFRRICGGSRSRAYAHTGDYLEADPACAYTPPGFVA
jgi:AdoMet-dependent heme synthase